ncbi:hypothetical protein [Phaeovulum sp.]|uniref:hypothetical protein n=1 Tax=Phaeovulum sp. TaxID=2934796 RepID=UPI0027321D69|nr:hypothetical protein [Phaeovulum sp.]MDP1667614.1 hypothetical protein [Phaeovulum sp.]MDZ4118495.1 hypothetical protein [Phaeovulum sp.]
MEYPLAQALYQRIRQRAFVLANEARRVALDAAAVGVAALFALAAVGCAVAALWLALAPLIGAPSAALAAATALLVAAAAVLWLRRLVARARARRAVVPPPAGPDLADAALEAFGANRYALLLGAVAAGAAIAERRRDG